MVNDTLLHSVFILGGAQHPMTALADLSKGFLMTKERLTGDGVNGDSDPIR